jgi:long-chain acyl-CoA synthetase
MYFFKIKKIFKLSHGEYVAPEKLEIMYNRSPLIQQSFIYSTSLKSGIVAIIVPDPIELKKVANENGIEGKIDDLIKEKKILNIVMNSIGEICKENKLPKYEYVRRIHLTNELFSIENDLLTPTFKLKRSEVLEYYKKEIDLLLSKIE